MPTPNPPTPPPNLTYFVEGESVLPDWYLDPKDNLPYWYYEDEMLGAIRKIGG